MSSSGNIVVWEGSLYSLGSTVVILLGKNCFQNEQLSSMCCLWFVVALQRHIKWSSIVIVFAVGGEDGLSSSCVWRNELLSTKELPLNADKEMNDNCE